MWSLFYRNLRLLILSICLILVWGLSSYQILPRMEDPEFSQRYAGVLTEFPGASASRVESLVTEKIERELSEIEEVKQLTSTSLRGSSAIFVEINDTVKNVEQVWSRVRDRLADVAPQLPPGSSEPKYKAINPRAYVLIVAITWELDAPPNYGILHRKAEELKDMLSDIPGTGNVEFFGEIFEEIVVAIDPVRLQALGLTPQQLAQQIRANDAKVAAGQMYGDNNNLLIEVKPELDSLDRISEIPIRLGNSGEFARLADVATVTKGIVEPPPERAIIDGKASIALAVKTEPNLSLDRWTTDARQVLSEFADRNSPAMGLDVILELNRYVESRLNGLFQNLFLGIILVFGTTLVMMGWKSSLVVGSALPLSVLMVFGGMNLLGITLNQISVTGLVIALGLLIDNAIVVVDEVAHLLQQGIKPELAISQSISELAIPLLASTMTTVLTFLPIVLLPGDEGEFIGSVGTSVIIALSSSLLLSLTIVPALTGRVYARDNRWSQGVSYRPLRRLYQRLLDLLLGRPILGVLLALILPVSGFMVAGSLSEQFFPPSDRDQFLVEYELPASASMGRTRSVVESGRELLLGHGEIVKVYSFLGTIAPAFYYNFPAKLQNMGANYGSSIVAVSSNDSLTELVSSLQDEFNQAFPSARVLVRQAQQGYYISAQIEVRIYGPDLEILQELGDRVRRELVGVRGIVQTKATSGNTLSQLVVRVDPDRARSVGLDPVAIAEQLNADLEGSAAGSLLEGKEELSVRVRLSNSDRANLDEIASLEFSPNLISGDNASVRVPLSAIADIELVPQLASISRRDGRRVNTIQGFTAADVLASEVLAEFKQRLDASGLQLPPGYSLEFGGESAERNQAVDNLMSTVGVLLVIMVATLVVSFGSFRSAAIVALVGGCSIGLALFSLWIFGYPLGFMAMLGTVGLIGVAINDSIVVLAALRADPAACQGDPKAARVVVVRSTRHVLTTTITTIASFVPLLLDGGEFWPPLAICIAGGVGGATLLALFFVPCAYLLAIKKSKKYKKYM